MREAGENRREMNLVLWCSSEAKAGHGSFPRLPKELQAALRERRPWVKAHTHLLLKHQGTTKAASPFGRAVL